MQCMIVVGMPSAGKDIAREYATANWRCYITEKIGDLTWTSKNNKKCRHVHECWIWLENT